MSIQRYGAYGTHGEPEGEFVTYEDYAANAERLGEALALSDAELAKWMARAAMEETQRKHTEAALTALRERANRYAKEMGRMNAERDALRERVARLVGAIEDAPHEKGCSAFWSADVCSCWKRTVLEGK